MAATFIEVNKSTPVGAAIDSALRQLVEGREKLRSTLATMAEMKDGDGSLAAHFDRLASLGNYGAGDYADANAAAKASFDELNSLYAKLSTDAQVQEVASAISQAAARLGVMT